MIGRERREVGARGRQDLADALAALEQERPAGVGLRARRAARPVEERRADDRLEAAIWPESADCEWPSAARRPERAEPRGRLERCEMEHLQPPPS